MKNKLVLLLLASLLAGCSGNDGNAPNETKAGDNMNAVGTDIATSLLDAQYDKLYGRFSNDLKNMVTLTDFRSMGQSFFSDVDSLELVSDVRLNGYASYVWSDPNGAKALTATLDESGTIAGIEIAEDPRHPETDGSYSETTFRLPFRGEWLVFWGGQHRFLNYHYAHDHIRYAYDFVVAKNEASFSGDPLLNESYYAFGKPVLAPADGVVVASVDGIADNVPVGAMNEAQAAGNVVLIKHANGEVSMIAHLKNGSVKVKAGDPVKAGEQIGECGNSGNSSEPHVHFQATAAGEDPGSATIPVTFTGGARPVRGDLVVGD